MAVVTTEVAYAQTDGDGVPAQSIAIGLPHNGDPGGRRKALSGIELHWRMANQRLGWGKPRQ